MKMRNLPATPSLEAGYYESEKDDGIRVLWDGGCSRGDNKANVPWANTEKDARYVSTQVATGLWTQYGHVVHAPKWFLDRLPNAVLSGELFAGRGNWQTLSSIVKKQVPDEVAWDQVAFKVHDMPVPELMFEKGVIRYGPKHRHICRGGLQYFIDNIPSDCRYAKESWLYSNRRYVRDKVCWGTIALPIAERLIFSEIGYLDRLKEIVDGGGEGLVWKSQENRWTTDRTKSCFKIKPVNDGECVVTGWVEGKGKYTGMIGALVCRTIGDDNGLPNGVVFELSGMTDVERMLTHSSSGPRYFKEGKIISFKYRELSDSGVPKEPRYWRNA